MSSFKYLAQDIGLIHGFYASYSNLQSPDVRAYHKELAAVIKATSLKTLIAITADIYQKHNHKILKKGGFRALFRFFSAHNNPDEILTVWMKQDPNAKESPPDRQVDRWPSNCSVTLNGGVLNTNRLDIRTTKKSGYRKVRGAPLWYKIDKKYLVKDTD